ncbi:uncharacterized protein PHACADRAFT_254761 [Phanerochaete carnosa HHB-10118-sp]|uniref:F-box domain-containing protein n=1 Tax=Phanerochaete carnosa (strain HHB-10118-sp) TaxID=650164 RepID=K5X2Z2_PHACS|nr:uncharacterized protein PHACADRAFT_254761 [Phanerochaete carnosa HHB-10118-sp]EKM57177.1 hypothetical protein PHACADRAFT_254761 [Phanerochaete carnosa HHB-10118-sp]
MELSLGDMRLYNELVDMVIDHLHDDKASLVACSLTSRMWRNSSQYHLLDSITLLGVTSERGLEAFLAQAQQSSRIRHYVRELRIYGEGSWFGKYNAAELRQLCFGPKSLHSLAQMPALRRLFLYDLLWDSRRDGPSGLPLIRRVGICWVLEKLVLQHVTSSRFQDPGQIHHGVYAQDILDILSFFSEIKVLCFDTPRFEVDGCEASPPHVEDNFLQLQFPPRLRISSLIADPDALDNIRSSMAYNMLDRVCRFNDLHSFRVRIKPGDIEAVSHFVSMRAHSIRHYQLDMSAHLALARYGKHTGIVDTIYSHIFQAQRRRSRPSAYPRVPTSKPSSSARPATRLTASGNTSSSRSLSCPTRCGASLSAPT